MDEDEDNSRMALKIVFVLSLLLVSMDVLEIFFSYNSLIDYSNNLLLEVFEQCVKYHVITQMFFTAFATLAGLSACIMSLCLLINYQLFATKFLDSFIFYNFYAFGPFLLGSTILALFNYDKTAYNCHNEDYKNQSIDISTIVCLFISLLVSFAITVGYSVIGSFELFNNSIRFNSEGNYILGKLFWKYVFNRGFEALHHPENNNDELADHLNNTNEEILDER